MLSVSYKSCCKLAVKAVGQYHHHCCLCYPRFQLTFPCLVVVSPRLSEPPLHLKGMSVCPVTCPYTTVPSRPSWYQCGRATLVCFPSPTLSSHLIAHAGMLPVALHLSPFGEVAGIGFAFSGASPRTKFNAVVLHPDISNSSDFTGISSNLDTVTSV